MTARKFKFTPKRRRWVDERQAVMKGSALYPSKIEEDKYANQLNRLVVRMRKDYEREIKAVFKEFNGYASDASIASQLRILFSDLGSRYKKHFTNASKKIVEMTIRGISKSSKTTFEASLKEMSGGIAIKAPEMTEALKEMVTASVAENVSLIKTVSTQYHDRVEGAVLRSVSQGGKDLKTIFDEVEKTGEVASSRARLIARDQTNKINAQMGKERAKAAGLTKFEWIHSGGGNKPRKLHQELNGQIFEYDDPPIIDDKTGERGLPGQLINCGCVIRPIFEFNND